MKGTPKNTTTGESEQLTDEQSKKNMLIAFTWSPQTYLQRNIPIEGYKVHLPILRRLLKCCSKIQVNPELFVNGGLHYHAQLEVSDKIKWYRSVLPTFKSTGLVVCKKNPDSNWMKYITKDWDDMSTILSLDTPLDSMALRSRGKKPKDLVLHTKVNLDDFLSVGYKDESSDSESSMETPESNYNLSLRLARDA